MNLLYKVWNEDCLILMIEPTRIIPLDKPYSSWIVQLGPTLPSSEQVWAHSRILSSFFHTKNIAEVFIGHLTPHQWKIEKMIYVSRNELCILVLLLLGPSIFTILIPTPDHDWSQEESEQLKTKRIVSLNDINAIFSVFCRFFIRKSPNDDPDPPPKCNEWNWRI